MSQTISQISTSLVSTPQKAISAMSGAVSQTSNSLVSTPQKAISALPTPQRAISALLPSQSRTVAPPTETFPPSPGTFRHPRLTEIIARQSASTFTSRNTRNVLINSGALLLTFVTSKPIHIAINFLLSSANIPTSTFDAGTPLNLLRLLFLANIILALRPLMPYMSKQDEITDIPLTPSQRALLGLNPSASSTPASVLAATGNYITPPRYRHSSGTSTSTPTSDRRSISANYSISPSYNRRSSNGGVFSPSPAPNSNSGSPLVHKSQNRSQFNPSNTNDFDTSFSRSTTSHFGTSTSLGRSQSLKQREGRRGSAPFGESGTPSPSSRSKAAAGINYKWLYDKGSRMPKSESIGF